MSATAPAGATPVTGDPWLEIEEAALNAFSGSISLSAPGLVAAIRRATRYVHIDTTAKQIVLDRRAVLLGILAVGLQDTPSRQHGNSATWFADGVAARVNPPLASVVLGSALTGTDLIVEAFASGSRVIASESM